MHRIINPIGNATSESDPILYIIKRGVYLLVAHNNLASKIKRRNGIPNAFFTDAISIESPIEWTSLYYCEWSNALYKKKPPINVNKYIGLMLILNQSSQFDNRLFV